jgi:AcrR family transcriptional regulator
MGRPATVLDVVERLPPRPGPELDRVLDATERCVTRFGLRRASMTDIAREMGVARTTLYRQVSSLEAALALVASRQFHRFLDELVQLTVGGADAEAFIQASIRAVTFASSDPIVQRVVNAEPEFVAEVIGRGQLPVHAEQITDWLTPVFAEAMRTGAIRRSDPRLAAGWMVRTVFSLIAIPAEDGLETMVRFALEPVLRP